MHTGVRTALRLSRWHDRCPTRHSGRLQIFRPVWLVHQRRRLTTNPSSQSGTSSGVQNRLQLDNLPLQPPQKEQAAIANAGFGAPKSSNTPTVLTAHLPSTCPGCGALTHDGDRELPGYYTPSRKAVKAYIRRTIKPAQYDKYIEVNGEQQSEKPWFEDDEAEDAEEHLPYVSESPNPPPICDRCHYLMYESRGVPIAHPSVDAVADTIAESPYNRNHIYHVLDAADFPMSLVPGIYQRLSLAKPRTQNRRSPHSFSRKPTISFIVTRSDLLAPTKELVDGMMNKFISVLRTALGRMGEKLRLGNVHLVSSKRGWWTKNIKDDIWERGGGNWMVGKFNVGKSNLFEVVFPKGLHNRAPVYADLQKAQSSTEAETLSEDSLLPPPQPEIQYPTMPLVSSLPGTTASPIRLPFGRGKGELIDMPGLQRGGLEEFVRPEHKSDLVMTTRPTVTQYVIKAGQSLLLGGGLVRITPILDPEDRSTTVLAYPFVPLKSHVTSTDKADGTQTQQRQSGVESLLADEVGPSISSAGHFKLKTDVTKSRAGSMLRAGVDVHKLPFQVYATDILIEGVGWVELVCQVRKRRATTVRSSESHEDNLLGDEDPIGDALEKGTEAVADETKAFTPFRGAPHVGEKEEDQTPDSINAFPEVEIFTPNGRFIGQRMCLDVWQMWNSGKPAGSARSARPRRAMSGVKKQQKMAKRKQRKSEG
jgi:genetic interactor of prohibitins 3, mitochondrial